MVDELYSVIYLHEGFTAKLMDLSISIMVWKTP